MADLFLRNLLSDAKPGETAKVYTVAELTREVRASLESKFPAVWVTGEVSNLRSPGSGHLYFTLKDAEAQLRAVIWRGVASRLRFRLEDGMQVVAFGNISVYEPRGEYQLIISRLEPKGVGALQLAFEQLKRKLEAEGLFDPARKRPLPFLPQRIGVVTSSTGAAIRDILTVIQRRFARVHILLRSVRVQGKGAAEEIAEGIADLNHFSAASPENAIDCLIVGRGGGSLEDLWAFNEEPVARAIFASEIPVVSAVGHEIDFTIADFVADVRAATPSAAAELVVPRLDEIEATLDDSRSRLLNALQTKAEQARRLLESVLRSHGFMAPLERVRQWQQRLDDAAQRLVLGASRQVRSKRERLATVAGQMESLSPLKVLSRGYSITTKGQPAQIVKDAAAVRPGETIATRLCRGRLISRVEATEPEG
jgi:exodeoxyribonuclease VII large subunit